MSTPGFHILIYDWLQPLLQRLREKGLPVSPDTHLQVLKVFQYCGERITDGESLFHYLSPVLAKNGEQVKILRQEIREFLEQQFPPVQPRPPKLPDPDPDPTQTKPPQPSSTFALWARRAFIAFIIAAFLYLALQPRKQTVSAEIAYQMPSTYKGEILLSARNSFSNFADTKYVRAIWDFGDGTIDSSDLFVTHRYERPGIYTISLFIRKKGGAKVKIARAVSQTVACIAEVPPEIVADKYETDIGEEVRFFVQYDSMSVPAKSYAWYINDTIKARDTSAIVHKFLSSGPQKVRLELVGDQPDSACKRWNSRSFTAMVKEPESFIVNLSTGPTLDRPDSHVRTSWLWMMAIFSIFPASIALYIRRRLAKKDRESKAGVNAIIEQFSGRGSPWEIPFRNHDEMVEDEQGISQLSKLYKRRSQAETYYLNIPQTISSTIRSEGLLQPVYSSSSRPLEFLILIDKTKAKSQQVKLFEYLVSKFSRNDIYLEKFYFQSTPEICTNANHPNGVHISRLHDLYSGHTLIIFGTGYQFLEPHYPALKDSLTRYFKRWISRAICTPVSYADWNYREDLLQQAGAVFPADLKGQLLLFRVLEQSDLLQDDFKKYIDDAYTVKTYNFSKSDELAGYLNNQFLYQWLCAMAVYPHIDWNVMVAIGDALQAKHFRSDAVNYSSLLRLVRISWMVDGTWPDNLRLELLKDLEPAHEKTARETMVRILEEAALKVKPASAVYENVQTQLIINKFLLHAHDPANVKYQQYALAVAQFKNLWEQEKVMDLTLAEYLRKPAGDAGWPTLINNNQLSGKAGKSLTIDSYLKDGINVMKKKLAPAQTSLLVTSLFSASVLVLLLTMGTSFRDSGVDKLLRLTESDNQVTVLLHVGFNDCLDSVGMQTDSPRFVLQLPAGRQVELNADTMSRSIQMPYAWKDSLVLLSVKSKNTEHNHDTIFKINSNELTMGISGCPPPLASCNRWRVYNENAAQFQSSYSGDWYEVVTTPGRASYEPFHIEPGYINGKRIVETYRCPNDENNFKLILDNEDGTFRVVYMRTSSLPDNLAFAFNNDRFSSLPAALNDTSAPQPVTRQRFGTDASMIAANTLTTLRGRWTSEGSPQQNGGFTIATANGTTTLTSTSTRVTILAAERSQVSPTLTWYKLMVQDAQLRNGSMYVLQFSDSRILLSEEIRAPRNGLTRSTPSMGIFYPLTRADRSREYTQVSIESLPGTLNEIWQGGSSNRLLNIKLREKYIYYSVNDPNNASIFGLGDIYRRGNNTFKLVSPTRGGFQVMFLRNITPQGFEYSLCENYYKTAEEVAALDESFCDQFNTMSLYYVRSPQRIFVPVDGKTYNNTEARKFSQQVDFNDVVNGTKSIDSIVVYINRTNTPDENRTERFNLIKSNNPELMDVPVQWYQRSFEGTRFDRDYISAYISDVIKPNCTVTYNSIDETRKLSSPLSVCRLNLSSLRLSEVPREIFTFTNLAYLNLGETTIPDAALNDLRRRFAKLDIQYSRPRTDTEVELLSIVIRSNQFTPESRKIVVDIARQLAGDRNKKIRIEGIYYNDEQQKLIQAAISNTTTLLYNNKVNRQYRQVSERLIDGRKEQTTGATSPSLRIIGINYYDAQTVPPKTN